MCRVLRYTESGIVLSLCDSLEETWDSTRNVPSDRLICALAWITSAEDYSPGYKRAPWKKFGVFLSDHLYHQLLDELYAELARRV